MVPCGLQCRSDSGLGQWVSLEGQRDHCITRIELRHFPLMLACVLNLSTCPKAKCNKTYILLFLSPNASGSWIQTLQLSIMSWLFHHCATFLWTSWKQKNFSMLLVILFGKAGQEKNLSKAPVYSTNSPFNQLRHDSIFNTQHHITQ